MNPNIALLYQIANKPIRLIIGLMSGTSLDGLDVALCKCEGYGINTQLSVVAFETVHYADDFKADVKTIFSKKTVDLEKLCLLNEYIGVLHGQMVNNCLAKWGYTNAQIDAIASHGQTIYHAPKSLHRLPNYGNGTLQIGDGDHIAVTTGIITLSDFRQKHIAAGGEGAPLAVYGDYLIFSNRNENRIMLNIGGIANFTYLPSSLDANLIFSTDTGPGNTMMDAYVQLYFPGKYYDADATIAKQGNVHPALLNALKQDVFIKEDFPKTTGPELFNIAYLDAAKQKAGITNISHFDVMATLNRFSADLIVDGLQRCVTAKETYVVYTSGGGMHNPLLLQHIQLQLPNIVIKNTNELAISPDAKEAVLFALLANESLCGGNSFFGNNTPNISMGKISFSR
ncbi:MAG: anhydro-N-acetylmuramic acid kinase [Flavobacterium sp.]|nr:anhydro-N-acetylmuramic acid kinase [Flavobacterium sp.]